MYITNELQFIPKNLMIKLQSLHKELNTRYTYKMESPIFEKNGYQVYNALHNDLKIQVTIKMIENPIPQLSKYLKKLKETKVQNAIKIYEIFQSNEGLFIITEQVTFSNLKNALLRCKKLDDYDAIFISKVILGIHVDLLRAGFNWFGTEEDIQFTDNGLRLSWNNSIPYETQNPFPLILSKIAGKIEVIEQKLLPFPKSKILEDLISISSQNASQIGLNNNMKKKEKMSKKRGRNWICLKQYKNDFQYYQESVYFAVHKEIGFSKIKCFNAGKLDEQILNLNKTKNTFTKVIQNYDQQGKTYIISDYSNDGTLFNYVNKLKANSIALKQQQIQFFFYSLFEPLKLIQQSNIKSLCMLHIKNIYIENGIPKIGEPIPMNRQLIDQLKDKSQVPDFYFSQFKKNPHLKRNVFDTYSLGVLMYKLMYTQYPIFPQGKVHIPTSPNYNARLKATLQVLLNEGGMLKDLQKKIQVSQQVAKQVKANKNKLLIQKQKSQKNKGISIQEIEGEIQKQQKKQQENTEEHVQQGQNYEDDQDCLKLCCAQLDENVKHRNFMLDSLEQSPYSGYRICTKVLCILSLYIFLFYFFFIQSTFNMISNANSLARMNVTISTINYQITVSNSNNFYNIFNITDRSLASLVSTGCFINNYGNSIDYSSVALSSSYPTYLVFGFIIMVIILTLKLVQLVRFDIIKTLYNMSNLKANFNMSNYIIFNLFICSFINDHYIFYEQVFNTITSTCLGVTYSYSFGSTDTFFSSPKTFSQVFVTLFILHFVLVLLHFIMIMRTETIRYTRIFNPILIFLPFLITYTIIVRVGVISNYYYPSLIKDLSLYGSFFKSISYINILGIIPQILFLFEFLLEMIVDWLFWLTFDKRRRMLINDISSAGIII